MDSFSDWTLHITMWNKETALEAWCATEFQFLNIKFWHNKMDKITKSCSWLKILECIQMLFLFSVSVFFIGFYFKTLDWHIFTVQSPDEQNLTLFWQISDIFATYLVLLVPSLLPIQNHFVRHINGQLWEAWVLQVSLPLFQKK